MEGGASLRSLPSTFHLPVIIESKLWMCVLWRKIYSPVPTWPCLMPDIVRGSAKEKVGVWWQQRRSTEERRKKKTSHFTVEVYINVTSVFFNTFMWMINVFFFFWFFLERGIGCSYFLLTAAHPRKWNYFFLPKTFNLPPPSVCSQFIETSCVWPPWSCGCWLCRGWPWKLGFLQVFICTKIILLLFLTALGFFLDGGDRKTKISSNNITFCFTWVKKPHWFSFKTVLLEGGTLSGTCV